MVLSLVAVSAAGEGGAGANSAALRISVRRIAPVCERDDPEVEGVYRVSLRSEVASATIEKRASIALDVFHRHVAIPVPEHFKVTVVATDGTAVDRDASHDEGSASDAGHVEKICAAPLYVEGEDYALGAQALDAKYNPDGGGEHPKYTREDWRSAVANDETIVGYWVWVEEKLREEESELQAFPDGAEDEERELQPPAALDGIEPYPVGTQVLSVHGEMAHGADDQEHVTGPNARGAVVDILPDQEHCYAVAFPEHHDVVVHLSESELGDPEQYLTAPAGERI